MNPDERTILYVRRRRVLRAVGGVRMEEIVLSDARPCAIGRSPENDVVLGDSSVSRRHAQILPRGGDLVIVDLGSSNGVHVNGARVGEHTLADGDTVTIGECVFRFSDSDAAVPASAPARPPAPASAPAPAPGPAGGAPRGAAARGQGAASPATPLRKLRSLKLPSLGLRAGRPSPAGAPPVKAPAAVSAAPVPPRRKLLRLALVGSAALLAALLVLRVAMRPSGEAARQRQGGGPGPGGGTGSVLPPPTARELSDPNVQQAKIFSRQQEHGKALAAAQRALASGLDTPTVRELRDRIAKDYEGALAAHLRRADDMEAQMQYRPALGALAAAVELIGELNDPRLAEIRARISSLQAKAGG